jgi:hypothetical protein
MEKVRFVCLANSFKEGGRCLAGIVLDENNNPIVDNDNPKWIRPVCKSSYGEIPVHLVDGINILDILEVEVLNYPDLGSYQSENALFEENSLRVTGKYDKNNLNVLHDPRGLIFGNRGKAISEDDIAQHNHSLMFIKPNNFEIYQRTYDDNPTSQIRLIFTYRWYQYDLPVTDPVFLKKYQSNPEFVNNDSKINITISIGISTHQKLV